MSNSSADVIPTAQMAPSSATEKLARFQLLEAQINATHGRDSDEAKLMRKAILSNMSEEETIRNAVLLQISQYKPSTPEYYMLVSMTKGRTDAFDQAEFLAHEIYESEKTAVAMSYFTPPKSMVRNNFLENAQAGIVARSKNVSASLAVIDNKRSVFAEALARAASGSASAAGRVST
jgi:hypothetical protein